MSTIIFLFVFQPTAVIADLSEKDLIAKFDKAASSIIDKLVRINLKVRTTPPLLFYAPYRNLKQTVIEVNCVIFNDKVQDFFNFFKFIFVKIIL